MKGMCPLLGEGDAFILLYNDDYLAQVLRLLPPVDI
jgi:hypothetical protein